MNQKVMFTEPETANYLGLSTSTLRQARMNGARKNRIESPPFIRLGRAIRYLKADLDQWIMRHKVPTEKQVD